MVEHPPQHVPVLPNETDQWLQLKPGGTAVDGTVGAGGHALTMLSKLLPGGQLVCLDRDDQALRRASHAVGTEGTTFCHANYADLPEVLRELSVATVDGILLDLGISSDQLADRQRGFSFHADGPLDLRFDMSGGEPAWKLLNRLSAEHLADLIYEHGEERLSRRIARNIVKARETEPVKTANQLAAIVRRCYPRDRKSQIDPATRTFQALRIAVNEELKWLDVALRRLPDCLSPGGRLVIISFHSLEDRRVKHAFRHDQRLNVLTKRPVRPTEEEVNVNPRCRSARLRVAERTS